MQMQTLVLSPVHMNRRQPQDMLPLLKIGLVRGIRKYEGALRRIGERRAHDELRVKRDQWRAPGQEDGEAEVRAGVCSTQYLGALLLREQQACGHLGALAESQEPDPRARRASGVILVHDVLQLLVDLLGGGYGVEFRVFGQPA